MISPSWRLDFELAEIQWDPVIHRLVLAIDPLRLFSFPCDLGPEISLSISGFAVGEGRKHPCSCGGCPGIPLHHYIDDCGRAYHSAWKK